MKQSYEEALRRLEQIANEMEGNEPDIDSLAEKLKEAKKLITLLRNRLTATEKEINNKDNNEKD